MREKLVVDKELYDAFVVLFSSVMYGGIETIHDAAIIANDIYKTIDCEVRKHNEAINEK